MNLLKRISEFHVENDRTCFLRALVSCFLLEFFPHPSQAVPVFYYTNLTLLKLGGETAVLVWPRAHPSLMPASLLSSSIHPLFQISPLHSLPTYIVFQNSTTPFLYYFSDLIFPASPPTCPSVLTRHLLSFSLSLFLSAHPHLPTSSCHYQKTTCTAL